MDTNVSCENYLKVETKRQSSIEVKKQIMYDKKLYTFSVLASKCFSTIKKKTTATTFKA